MLTSCWPGKQAEVGLAGGESARTLTRAAWSRSWGRPAAQLAAASLLTHMCIYSRKDTLRPSSQLGSQEKLNLCAALSPSAPSAHPASDGHW